MQRLQQLEECTGGWFVVKVLPSLGTFGKIAKAEPATEVKRRIAAHMPQPKQ